jgi:hypothetical protein
MAMLMPDFVIAVALKFQDLGLTVGPLAFAEPLLDPETLWRIPPDIDVVPVSPRFARLERRTLWFSISDVPAIEASPKLE